MKVLRQTSFTVFTVFCMSAKLFNMKVQDGAVIMDLRESMWDSEKVILQSLHVQLAAKLFCLETFKVYGIWSANY